MGKMVSGSQMKSFCVKLGLYNWFKSRTDSGPHQAAFDEMQGGELNFIEGHKSNVITLMDAIIESTSESDTYWDYVPTYNDVLKVVELLWVEVEIKNALIQLKADCIAYSNQSDDTPTPEPEIETNLPSSTDEQTVQFTIAETVNPSKRVKILQRYGSTDDLTDWHELNNLLVRFHQDIYRVFIPSCAHEVRELKLVSPVSITVM